MLDLLLWLAGAVGVILVFTALTSLGGQSNTGEMTKAEIVEALGEIEAAVADLIAKLEPQSE